MMAETAQSLLRDLEAAAVQAGEAELAQRIHAVATAAGEPKLRVLLAGSPCSPSRQRPKRRCR